MLYAFGFERLGVVVGDLYFVNPEPEEGQEGPERGVRLELRLLERGDLKGSIYSAQPIAVGRPLWRVDLLESVDSAPGSLDRAHHHPAFDGWEPGRRHFVDELTAAPLRWLEGELADPQRVLERAGVPADEVGPHDVTDLRRAAPEILDVVRRMLERVAAGELGRPRDSSVPGAEGARVGWL